MVKNCREYIKERLIRAKRWKIVRKNRENVSLIYYIIIVKYISTCTLCFVNILYEIPTRFSLF